MRNRLWVVIAVALGLLTAILVQSYIQQEIAKAKRKLMVGREPVEVLLAAVDIPEQTTISPEMVVMEARPADAIQPRALDDPEAAIGKIALVPMYQGEQLLSSKLAAPENANILSQKTPPGRRAVTIGIDEISGVGGFIHPGDFVDILGIFNLPTADGKQVPVTVTLLQRVAVLAAGARFSEFQSTGAGSADTVTLALTPQETELVLFAREQGKLQLSLRPKVDSEVIADLKPMSVDALVGAILGPQMAQAPPPPPPTETAPAPRQVEIYRGLQREVVALPEP